MVNIYKFHHCPSLLVTPGFEPTTSRSQSGDANHSAIPPPRNTVCNDGLGVCWGVLTDRCVTDVNASLTVC